MHIPSEEFRAWDGFRRSESNEDFTFLKHFLYRVLKHFSSLALLALQISPFLLILSFTSASFCYPRSYLRLISSK